MPQEIEIKLKLDSHATVVARLAAWRAEHRGSVRETNIFFDRPDHALRHADAGLRVRFTTPHSSPPETKDQPRKAPTALLTFKGPAAAAGLHSREAFDLHLTPHDQIIPLLRALGFEQLFLFEKDRDSWRMDDCSVELDTLPYFGCFLEIEGPSEEAVQAVQRDLGLGAMPAHHESYAKMVGAYLRQRQAAELRF